MGFAVDAKGGESFGSRLAGIYSDGLKGIGNDIVGGAIGLLNSGAKAAAPGEGLDPNDVGNVPIWQPFAPKDPAVAANFVEAFRPAMIAAVPEGAGGAADAAPLIKAGSAGGETAGKSFSQAVKDAAKAENPLNICVYCRREGVATQVDHSIPKSRGGNATLDNAQLACPHCNASKGARDFPVNPPPGYRGEWPPAHWGQ